VSRRQVWITEDVNQVTTPPVIGCHNDVITGATALLSAVNHRAGFVGEKRKITRQIFAFEKLKSHRGGRQFG